MPPRLHAEPPPVPPQVRAARSADAKSHAPPPIPAAARRGRAHNGATPPPVPSSVRRLRATPPPIPAAALAALGTTAESIEAAKLVIAAKAGNHRAFGELVRRYRPRILALALHMTGSVSDAEDIAQEVFLKAFQRIGDFEGRSEFFTWVYRIAINRTLNVNASNRVRRAQDLNDPRVAIAAAVDAEGDPRRALQLRETYAQLVFAFDRLSPLLRTTVALTTLQGLSYAEAAVVLNTTEGTIAWRIHEARSQLRASLSIADERHTRELVRAARRRAQSEEGERHSHQLAFALACVVFAGI